MSVIDNIKSFISTNSIKKSYFVKWYVDSKDKSEEDYNDNCKTLANVTYQTAIHTWLMEEEVQEAIKAYLKQQRNVKMLEIYDSMYNKAIDKGDVNSAKWVEEFFKSNFFEDTQDEINQFMDGIDIPALQNSGRNDK